MTAVLLLGTRVARCCNSSFHPCRSSRRCKTYRVLIEAVMLGCLGAAFLALWRAAPDYRVFRSLGLFSVAVGIVQSLDYFGGNVLSLSVRATRHGIAD